jgi:hypothetical protein
MRRGVLVVAAVGSSALALWSLRNPGYYYLGRAALFTSTGAGAVYLWTRGRQGRYAFAASFLYLALLLMIAVAEEWIATPSEQVESINLLLLPLTVVFLAAGVFAAARARFRHRP